MSKAAQQLHVSQQNISKSLKQLESELGCTVFMRSKKGTALTAQGEMIYQFAKQQMQKYRQLKERLDQLQLDQLQGTLKICTMNSGSSMIIPQMLCEFYKNYPQVTLEITDGDMQTVIQTVQDEKADLGIITYYMIHQKIYPSIPDNLQMKPLQQGKSYYWVRENSLYARKGYITLLEANRESMLLYDEIDLDLLKRLLFMHGLELQIGLQSKNLYLLGKLVAEGRGVLPDMLFPDNTLMYSYAFQQQNIVAVPLESQIDDSGVAYLVKRDQQKNRLLSHAVRFLQAEVGQERDG